MKKNNFNEERTNEVINALWLKLFADNISRTASNNLTNIYTNFDGLIDYMSIDVMMDACSDVMSNDRSRIPHYLKKVWIDDSNALRIWLKHLKDDELFSDEEMELLYNDYRSIAEEPENGDDF